MNLALRTFRCRAGTGGLLQTRGVSGRTERLLTDLPQPRVEGAAILLVDTSLLHRFDDDAVRHRRQLVSWKYLVSSRAAAQSLAENYVGCRSQPSRSLAAS